MDLEKEISIYINKKLKSLASIKEFKGVKFTIEPSLEQTWAVRCFANRDFIKFITKRNNLIKLHDIVVDKLNMKFWDVYLHTSSIIFYLSKENIVLFERDLHLKELING